MKIAMISAVCFVAWVISNYANAAGKSEDAVMNGRPFMALQTQITDLETQVDQLAESQEQLLRQMNDRIAILEGEVTNLQAMMDANMGDISSLQQQMDAATEELNMLQSNVSVMQNSLSDGCPSGMAIRRILEDGSVICASSVAGGGEGKGIVRTSYSVTNMLIASADSPRSITLTAACPAGYDVTGGGYELTTMPGISVTRSGPGDAQGWTVTALSQTSRIGFVSAIVNCASQVP